MAAVGAAEAGRECETIAAQPGSEGGRRLLRRWATIVVVAVLLLSWVSWRVQHTTPGPGGKTPATGPVLAGPGAVEPNHGSNASAQTDGQPAAWYRCTMTECNDPGSADPKSRCPVCGMKREPVSVDHHTAIHDHTGTPWYRCTMTECNDPGSADPKSRCPVCGMKRELVSGGGAGPEAAAPSEIHLDERARRLASLATEEVIRRPLLRRIRAVGMVDFDEQRYVQVSARISGTIDSLAADYTGKHVRQGEELLQIYSLDLLQAQNELLRLIWGFGRIAGRGRNRSVDQDLVTARHRLELMGMTAADIDRLLEVDHEHPYLSVTAPINGTIIRKEVYLGGYVGPGDTLFEIADLGRVWLLLDTYEDDLPWISLDQEVVASTRSLPGREFAGRIAFIDPVVDDSTRTISVRVEVDNPERLLKPGMFTDAHVVARLAGAAGGEPPLSVPRAAVLSTGERSIVYLESAPGTYRGVEITTGPLAEDETGRQYYPVLAGLEEGVQVVTRGGFVIDSQMQIAGRPSLFTARGLDGHEPKERSHGQGSSPPIARAVLPSPTVQSSEPMHHLHRHARDTEPVSSQAYQRQAAAPHRDDGVQTEQELCPVMGNPIDPSVYVDYRRVRIYFCCHLCTPKFLAEPERYLDKLPASLQERISENQQRLAQDLGAEQ